MKLLTRLLVALGCAVLLLTLSYDVKADDFAYAVGGAGTLETLDLQTGTHAILSVTPCATATPPLGVTPCIGLGVTDGTLFLVTNAATEADLYAVDQTNGSTTLIGSGSGLSVAAFGSTTKGLFAIDTSGNVYSIDLSTGSTLLGSIGITPTREEGLSVNSGTLYFTDAGSLYTLNTTTGAATLIGAMGTTDDVGAMLYENGTLYGTDAPGDHHAGEIFTINPLTGAATDTGINDARVVSGGGLAPDPVPAPEPGTMSLLLSGLLGLGVLVGIKSVRPDAGASEA